MAVETLSISSLGELSEGDHIVVPGEKFFKGKLYKHHLLVVIVESSCRVRVIHNLHGHNIVEETMSLKPDKVTVLRYKCSFTASEAIERARKKINSSTRTYSLLSNNCEHFVTWAKTGKGISFQVKRAVKTAVGAGAGAGTGGVAGGVGGVIAGALLGSVFPVVGTIVGGVVGGVIGAVGLTVAGGSIGGAVGNLTTRRKFDDMSLKSDE